MTLGNYEALQDKLAQLRDAREALDALREDHKEKRRREMEELERQRQIQMAHKLDIMRQKKHVCIYDKQDKMFYWINIEHVDYVIVYTKDCLILLNVEINKVKFMFIC